MIVTFEYQNNWTRHGIMTVDLEKFLPNTLRKSRKLFKFMVPNLDSQKIQEIEDWLSGKEDKRYLKLFEEVQKKCQ